MATVIRPATPADAEAVARLTCQLGYEVQPREVASRLSRMLSRSDQQFLIAEAGGRAVGWVHMLVGEYIDADAFVVIGGLVVDQDHRRTGIARLLLTRAEDWARQRGCSLVRLTSSSTRTGAHRFYERVGYTHVKTQYAFAKPVGEAGQDALRKLVPQV